MVRQFCPEFAFKHDRRNYTVAFIEKFQKYTFEDESKTPKTILPLLYKQYGCY